MHVMAKQVMEFQVRGCKLERFFSKIQPKRNNKILRIGVVGRCQKVAKLDY